jgi:hypothetical protein
MLVVMQHFSHIHASCVYKLLNKVSLDEPFCMVYRPAWFRPLAPIYRPPWWRPPFIHDHDGHRHWWNPRPAGWAGGHIPGGWRPGHRSDDWVPKPCECTVAAQRHYRACLPLLLLHAVL